jgi:hypothetical protein
MNSQLSVTGSTIQPVSLFGGKIPCPKMRGTTELTLSNFVVEESTTVGGDQTRKALIPINKITCIEIRNFSNPVWLLACLVTLAFFGLGLIFLIPYFLTRKRAMVIHTDAHFIGIGISGDIDKYKEFQASVLASIGRYGTSAA